MEMPQATRFCIDITVNNVWIACFKVWRLLLSFIGCWDRCGGPGLDGIPPHDLPSVHSAEPSQKFICRNSEIEGPEKQLLQRPIFKRSVKRETKWYLITLLFVSDEFVGFSWRKKSKKDIVQSWTQHAWKLLLEDFEPNAVIHVYRSYTAGIFPRYTFFNSAG